MPRPVPLKQSSDSLLLWFVYHTAVILIFRQCSCAGESQVVVPSQPIVAMVGKDIILPCSLNPSADASGLTVEWARLDLNPRFVHVCRDGLELESKKHGSFQGRTSLSRKKMENGDVSLKLSQVKLSDEGKYRCFIPGIATEATVELVVGIISPITIILSRPEKSTANRGRVIQCHSKAWYPKPEISWLDGEQKYVSAVSTDTARGPDGLYTISSKLTMEERHGNNFTCRVQQKKINQTREAHIHISDDIFMACSTSGPHIAIILAIGLSFVLTAAFVVRKWRLSQKKRNKTRTDLHSERRTESLPFYFEGF